MSIKNCHLIRSLVLINVAVRKAYDMSHVMTV
jgi:hypothetical protein